MSIAAMRWLAAALLAYAVSRLTWRGLTRLTGPARLLVAHGLSAALLVAFFAAARQSLMPAIPLLVTQAGWLLFDGARGRAARGPAARTGR